MRGGGGYDAGASSVSIQGDAGPFAGNASEDGFAQVAGATIERFRAAEAGWSSFSPPRGRFCAKAVFSPPSNALRLNGGNSGRVAVYAKADAGGRATGARWTLTSPTNATFSPTTVRAPSPQITYRVVGSPRGNRVQVIARFTSTAGVGKDTWTQPL